MENLVACTKLTVEECLRDDSKLNLLKRTYKEYMGHELHISCKNCINDGIILLTHKLRLMAKQGKEGAPKYRLKEDRLLNMHYSGLGFITNKNLTDELAIRVIEVDEAAYGKLFDGYEPEQFKKDLANLKKRASKKAEGDKAPEPKDEEKKDSNE